MFPFDIVKTTSFIRVPYTLSVNRFCL